MGVTQNFLNLDAYYRRTSGDKIIINDLSYFSIDDMSMLNNSLMTIYENSDTISTVPSCDCGNIKGRYLLNKVCHECGTTCKESHSKIEPLLWLRAINGNLKFLNPDFWLILSKLLDKKIDYVRYLCDVKYNPPIEIPAVIHGIKQMLGGIRTYENTMVNIENILKYLLESAAYKTTEKQEQLQLLLHLYTTNKQDLFTEHIPIINKKLFVMESTNKGKFVNLVVSDIIDVVMMWIKVTKPDGDNNKKWSNSTAVVISKLASLYNSYFEDYVVQKIGMFRKHVYGARSHFTFRCVITSISGPHQHNEIHVPFAVGVTAFRLHLLNKLLKRGYKYKYSSKLLYQSVKKYNPLIDDLLQELVTESPYMGLPVILQRNPSLTQSSALRLFITKFKPDTKDTTISLSVLSAKYMNADLI